MSRASMLFALRTMYDPAVVGAVTYGLELDGEQFSVVIDKGRIEISRGRPADADARIVTDIGTLRLVVFLGTGVRAAEEAGALRIEGDRRAAARLPKYFRRPATQ